MLTTAGRCREGRPPRGKRKLPSRVIRGLSGQCNDTAWVPAQRQGDFQQGELGNAAHSERTILKGKRDGTLLVDVPYMVNSADIAGTVAVCFSASKRVRK